MLLPDCLSRLQARPPRAGTPGSISLPATVSFTLESPRGLRTRGPWTASVAYERTGAGAPLLLHRIGHHRQAWDPAVPVLAVERDVIAVDLPGFGVSPALPDAP
ncbi:hypothetical protein [Streptomyces brevispora]|uniref:Alpha/beta hydrolase family protein n=1 Tax=Streptomyces brevispora TaxID=887462 RepID=A0ABZ1GB36_9ACTN|nr:hypothetical protein [Streptomyces brevispora]WSC17139.1 hypothetical protein OIE64_32845 [Streptomyces brevispora]